MEETIKKKISEINKNIGEVVNAIAGSGGCLVCGKDLDKDLKRDDWNIPLCKKHRLEYLESLE